MPLTISEIGIRVRVEPKPATAPGGDVAGESRLDAEQREQLIQECIRRTLAVVDARRER